MNHEGDLTSVRLDIRPDKEVYAIVVSGGSGRVAWEVWPPIVYDSEASALASHWFRSNDEDFTIRIERIKYGDFVEKAFNGSSTNSFLYNADEVKFLEAYRAKWSV